MVVDLVTAELGSVNRRTRPYERGGNDGERQGTDRLEAAEGRHVLG